MSRRCERPGCGERASVSYGFDADQQLVWFAPLTEEGPAAGSLCHRHAASMALPKGWWLDDRRVDTPTLFAPPEPVVADAGHQRAPSRPRKHTARAPSLPLAEPVVPEPVVALPAAEPWMPTFDTHDDLGGLLDAKTPLLARAFGRDRPRAGA